MEEGLAHDRAGVRGHRQAGFDKVLSSLYSGRQSLQISSKHGLRPGPATEAINKYRQSAVGEWKLDAISVKTYTLQPILPYDTLKPKMLSECLLSLPCCSCLLLLHQSCLSKARFLEALQCNLPDVFSHDTMVSGLSSGSYACKLCPAAIRSVVADFFGMGGSSRLAP